MRSLSLPDRGDLPQRRLAGASLWYDGLVRHLGGCRLGSVPTVLFGFSRQIGDHWRCPDRVILYRMLEAQSQGRLAKAHPDGRIMAA